MSPTIRLYPNHSLYAIGPLGDPYCVGTYKIPLSPAAHEQVANLPIIAKYEGEEPFIVLDLEVAQRSPIIFGEPT
jgi:hypothetical protein